MFLLQRDVSLHLLDLIIIYKQKGCMVESVYGADCVSMVAEQWEP